jgi:hypothetical protein
MITLEFHKSESTSIPELIDMISSPTTVYIRENIQEETKIENEEEYTIYTYDEAILTKEEYAIYLAEANTANIDYLSMMDGVDL